jgi:protein-S-isoprenylcysteine O-methyltransferase Ste14
MGTQSSLFATLFFLCYLAVVFVWPSVRTYRQTGIYPVAFGGSDSAHDFIGWGFKVLLTVIALTIAVSWSPGLLSPFLLHAAFLSSPALQWAGAALCLTALLWTAVAQRQMGRSWRIGIDKQHRTALQTTGLFSVSRNPVFLGLLTALLGLFLLLPNVLTLVCVVAGYLLIQVAIRLEEEHLAQQHGNLYRHYKARVRRLL